VASLPALSLMAVAGNIPLERQIFNKMIGVLWIDKMYCSFPQLFYLA